MPFSHHNKIIPLLLALVFIMTTGQGCFIKFKKKEIPKTFDGGMYKSLDQGETWTQSSDVLSIKGGVKFNSINVLDVIFDPQDNSTIYALTEGDGVYYSIDQARSWLPITSLGKIVADIVVDPKDKCNVYAVMANKAMKSIDCLRTFTEIFHTDTTSKQLITVAVDAKNSRVISAATSSTIYKSTDGGESWRIATNLSGGIRDLRYRFVGGNQILYVLTDSNYVYKSSDQGETWESIGESMKRLRGSEHPVDFSFDDSGPDSLIYVYAKGVLRSSDGGKTWSSVNLISSPSPVSSFSVSPNNKNLIFYTTSTTLYRSDDGGQNWTTKTLPTGARVAKKMIFDKINPKLVYMLSGQPTVTAKTK